MKTRRDILDMEEQFKLIHYSIQHSYILFTFGDVQKSTEADAGDLPKASLNSSRNSGANPIERFEVQRQLDTRSLTMDQIFMDRF